MLDFIFNKNVAANPVVVTTLSTSALIEKKEDVLQNEKSLEQKVAESSLPVLQSEVNFKETSAIDAKQTLGKKEITTSLKEKSKEFVDRTCYLAYCFLFCLDAQNIPKKTQRVIEKDPKEEATPCVKEAQEKTNAEISIENFFEVVDATVKSPHRYNNWFYNHLSEGMQKNIDFLSIFYEKTHPDLWKKFVIACKVIFLGGVLKEIINSSLSTLMNKIANDFVEENEKNKESISIALTKGLAKFLQDYLQNTKEFVKQDIQGVDKDTYLYNETRKLKFLESENVVSGETIRKTILSRFAKIISNDFLPKIKGEEWFFENRTLEKWHLKAPWLNKCKNVLVNYVVFPIFSCIGNTIKAANNCIVKNVQETILYNILENIIHSAFTSLRQDSTRFVTSMNLQFIQLIDQLKPEMEKLNVSKMLTENSKKCPSPAPESIEKDVKQLSSDIPKVVFLEAPKTKQELGLALESVDKPKPKIMDILWELLTTKEDKQLSSYVNEVLQEVLKEALPQIMEIITKKEFIEETFHIILDQINSSMSGKKVEFDKSQAASSKELLRTKATDIIEGCFKKVVYTYADTLPLGSGYLIPKKAIGAVCEKSTKFAMDKYIRGGYQLAINPTVYEGMLYSILDCASTPSTN